uniref:Uncharacterized protein n=1 Tax=Rubinisphaera brasiliensis (strain ATCC 49424 / DSM 5305 / JCM 21570 / IAM 15109 / NBRC 103401 / IFAM 1448) TaxID=756272 RepID=F0STJ3_RUBBR|nr:hypothetical protein Plabr_3884 [Rubinisphaera brasiliensis DSM 5305]
MVTLDVVGRDVVRGILIGSNGVVGADKSLLMVVYGKPVETPTVASDDDNHLLSVGFRDHDCNAVIRCCAQAYLKQTIDDNIRSGQAFGCPVGVPT